MSLNDQYAAAMVHILRAADPVVALQAVQDAPETDAALRALLAMLDPDGLRITALLVLQLRFNRLLSGSPQASAAFAEEPQAFSHRFRRYHAAVPPRAENPVQEARDYADWCSSEAAHR
jgi:uncharacterized protein YeaO (DUF488 family)